MPADMSVANPPTARPTVQSGGCSAMSVTTRSETYECAHCGGPRTDATHGSYCSADCYHRAKGEALLNRVEHASQFCATCYAHLRDVEPLGELNVEGPDHPTHEDDQGWRNVADGVQHPRAALTYGIDAHDGPHGYHEFQRESCACGAVDPNATTAELQQAIPDAVRERLFLAVRWLGWTDDDLPLASRERYDDALAECPHDAALAVGRSVYGGEDG